MVLALCSYVLQLAGVTAVNLKTNEIIHIRSLISAEGLDWLLTNLIKNYINFPPLGMIIVLTFGLGVASETGLLQTLIHHSMHNIPRKYVTLAVVFISLMSHIASDAAIVIMPPLAAMLFYSMGRHPLVGFACSLAAIYSGFTANILIVTTDVLLSGITTQAIRTIDATMTVTPIDNWYFMSFAVFYLTAVTTFITEKFVEPRMGVYDPAHAQENLTIPDVSPEEKKALRHTLIAAVLYLAVVFLMAFPDNGLLRNSQTHSLLGSPLLRGVIPLLCGFLLTVGLTYGVSIRKIKNADDMIHCMTNAVKGLSGFLVMAFFIAQFIAAFAWTNMSTMIAMKGALFLKDVGMTGLPALICFMLFGQLLGLFTSSGSAVWACCRQSSSPCSCFWDIIRPSYRPPSGPRRRSEYRRLSQPVPAPVLGNHPPLQKRQRHRHLFIPHDALRHGFPGHVVRLVHLLVSHRLARRPGYSPAVIN